jgi:Tfp pilus assembly protein PilZ
MEDVENELTGDSLEGEERRAAVRHRVFRIEVRVATFDSFRASYLRDVSTGGLFVRSAKPLPVGTKVMVQLKLASLDPVALPGVVVRLEPNGFGVRFSMLNAAQQASLDALLAHVQPPSLPTPVPMASSPSVLAADLAASLSAELAEAKGAIEAYEQTLALLREAEMEAVQRAEAAEHERRVLVDGMKELTARVAALEAERASLQTIVSTSQALLQNEREVAKSALARSEAERASLQQLETELETLRASLGNEEVQALRREAQNLSQMVDEERLKALAMQRALERFVAMGGSPPTPPPTKPSK